MAFVFRIVEPVATNRGGPKFFEIFGRKIPSWVCVYEYARGNIHRRENTASHATRAANLNVNSRTCLDGKRSHPPIGIQIRLIARWWRKALQARTEVARL